MSTITKGLLLTVGVLLFLFAVGLNAMPPKSALEYVGKDQVKLPTNYREWVYLTSGFNMSYNPDSGTPGHSMFDNVFVNPDAYAVFTRTGTWPDKTTFVLEARRAETKGSLAKSGNFQSTDVMGLDVHVKDATRFSGNWAFFGGFDKNGTGKLIPQSADCYSCHADHAAVDTTFVQFYPTLIDIAKKHGTLSPAYVKETEAAKEK
jgi:hypothetical protein